MQTIQQQLNALQTSVKRQRFAIVALSGIIVASGFIAAVRPAGDATFDTITCKKWKVVDADGKERITARTDLESNSGPSAGISWFDKSGAERISAYTFVAGSASIVFSENEKSPRIVVATNTRTGHAAIGLVDKELKPRIQLKVWADGTIELPTKDLTPPKKP